MHEIRKPFISLHLGMLLMRITISSENEPRGPGIPTDASAVEALVGMIKSWEESGFLQDESSQKEADYLYVYDHYFIFHFADRSQR